MLQIQYVNILVGYVNK